MASIVYPLVIDAHFSVFSHMSSSNHKFWNCPKMATSNSNGPFPVKFQSWVLKTFFMCPVMIDKGTQLHCASELKKNKKKLYVDQTVLYE